MQHPDPSQTKRNINLTWASIQDMVSILKCMVEPLRPKRIVAVSRGGLVPATLLSHKLSVPLVIITASAYEGTRRTLEKPIKIEGWKEEYNSSDTIIVDDIMDTGDTWDAILYGDGRLASDMKATLAVLVKKTEARFINHHTFVMQTPQDVWVNFPWE